MADYAECKKRYADKISDTDMQAIEDTAATFRDLNPNEAYSVAISARISALESGKSALIKQIQSEVQGRKGLGEVAPVVEAPKKKVAKKKVAKKKVAKKKVAKKKPVIEAPKKEVQDSLKKKIQDARDLESVVPLDPIAEQEIAYQMSLDLETKTTPETQKILDKRTKRKAAERKVEEEKVVSEPKQSTSPVKNPNISFVVKAKEAGRRALAMVNLTDSHIAARGKESGVHSITADTTFDTTFDTNKGTEVGSIEVGQDFDGPVGAVVAQIAKVFDVGKNTEDRRLLFTDNNKADSKKGAPTKVAVNATELVKLGALITGKSYDSSTDLAQQTRDNFYAGMSFLISKGYKYTPQKGNSLNIPSDIVIAGRNIKASDLEAVSERINTINKEIKSLEVAKNNGTLYKPFNKDNLELYRALKVELAAFGVQERENESFSREDVEVTGVVETDTHTFADMKPEYVATSDKLPRAKSQQVYKVGKTIEDKEVSYAEKLLKHVGIKINITIIDKGGVFSLLQDIIAKESKAKKIIADANKRLNKFDRGLKATNDSLISRNKKPLDDFDNPAEIKAVKELETSKRNAEVALGDYALLIDSLQKVISDQPKGRIIFNDNLAILENRAPIIFINNSQTKVKDRFFVITHELGHLVQRAMLDSAPTRVQKALREAAKNMPEAEFREWFANQMVFWAMNRKVPVTFIEKFFRDLGRILKKLWQRAISSGESLNTTFAEFMDVLVYSRDPTQEKRNPRTKLGKEIAPMVANIREGGMYLPASGRHLSADFTPMTPGLSNLVRGMKINAKKAFDGVNTTKYGRMTTQTVGRMGDSLSALHNAVIRSADSALRGMKPKNFKGEFVTEWLANQWHIRAGEGRGKGFTTIPTEIQQASAKWLREIKRISWLMPRTKNKLIDTVFDLKEGRLEKNSVAYKEIGRLLVLEEGLPDIVELEKKFSTEEAQQIIKGYQAVRKYLDELYTFLTDSMGLPVQKRKNYFPHAFDVSAITSDKAKFIRILKEAGLGKGTAGKTQDQVLEDFYQQLVASDGTIMDLALDTDGDVLGPSFQALSKRSFTPALAKKLQQFYIDDVMSVLTTYTHAGIKRAVIQKRFNPNNTISRDKRTGANTFDPMYEVNRRLDLAAKDYAAGKDSGLSPEQIATVRKTMEAYMGRLGANMNPKLRNMSALMITYQNFRLLSFVVLASIVDAGLIDVRSGQLFSALRESMKLVSDKEGRQALYDAAETIGAIRDDITEHVVNDQQSTTYMSHKMKAANEAYFRLVRMHQWTNISRVMSLSAGKTFLLRHANRPDTAVSVKYLEELGVTRQEILEWNGNITDIPPNIQTALNQFIDESVIRPSSAIRPTWASDPHFGVFFHLKQFMWGYHEQILRRVWKQTKDNDGLAKVVPIMLLAAATLPLAAAGYELRRLIGGAPEYTDKKGGDYFWEVVQRSGAPGIMQLYVDADEAEEFGQFAPFAMAGPTVSWLTDWLNKDFDVAMARSIPFVAQMPALRSYIAD